MSRRKVEIRALEPDYKYKSVEVTSLINHVMMDGKKSIAEKIVYGAFDILTSKGILDPLGAYKEALKNVKPFWNLRYRRMGGSTNTIPRQASPRQAESRGVKNIVLAARKRSDSHSMLEKLANEIQDAIKGRGDAMTQKENIDKTAKANQAFANLNW